MKSILLALAVAVTATVSTARANEPLPYCKDIMETVKLHCIPGTLIEDYGPDQVNECFVSFLSGYLDSEQGAEIREKCDIDYQKPANWFRAASEPYRFRDKKN
jgi:hypothetical protein